MSGIGDQLRSAREALGCSLEEAERQTRIRLRLLAALEADDLSVFSSPAQARGFLANYAKFLGLDADVLLASSSAGLKRQAAQPRRAPPRPVPPGQPRVQGGWRRVFNRDLIIGVVFTVFFGLLLTWGAGQLWQSVVGEPQAGSSATTAVGEVVASVGLTTGPAAADSETPRPTGPPTDAATPTAPLPTPLPNYVGVNLLVRAEQRVWLRAVVDGVEAFAGQLPPGATREFVGNAVVELWTGNALGTRVVFNGKDQGTLGGLGEVVIRLWTLDGPVTPTPSATPTPG